MNCAKDINKQYTNDFDKMAKFTASQHFVLHVKNAALLVLVVSSLFTVTEGWCSGCDEDDQICCGDVCIYGSGCSGYSCSSEWDCSSGETCCNNVCVNGSNCVGQYCSSSSDCILGEGCCSFKCKSGYAALDSLARQTVIAEVPGVFMNTVAEAHVVITTALSTLLFGSYLAQYLEHSSSFQ